MLCTDKASLKGQTVYRCVTAIVSDEKNKLLQNVATGEIRYRNEIPEIHKSLHKNRAIHTITANHKKITATG